MGKLTVNGPCSIAMFKSPEGKCIGKSSDRCSMHYTLSHGWFEDGRVMACLKIGKLFQFMAFQFQSNSIRENDDKAIGLGVPLLDKALLCGRTFAVVGKSVLGEYVLIVFFWVGMVFKQMTSK